MSAPVLHVERGFDAPRALVFANWTDPALLAAWFAPAGAEVIDCAFDARPGGAFRVEYRAASGARHVERGVVRAIAAPELLVLALTIEDERGVVHLESEITVRLEERDGGTWMSFTQTGFGSEALRDALGEGWRGCLDQLARQLAAESEIRALFAAWSQASVDKDLDGSMAPIADDVESYEHTAPLVHRGVDALRATCREGFERTPPGLRWEVPDLRVVVRGDVAITWGLNHMHGPGVDMWSRGTRVFQRIDGRWRMIHQHVSFAVDPATGAMVTGRG